MMIPIAFEDRVQEWIDDPEKCVLFLLHMMWLAGIKPSDTFRYTIDNGKVIIEGIRRAK